MKKGGQAASSQTPPESPPIELWQCIKPIRNQETFEQLKTLLKLRGATKIQGYGRESIVRLWKRYNFEARNTLVEVLI